MVAAPWGLEPGKKLGQTYPRTHNWIKLDKCRNITSGDKSRASKGLFGEYFVSNVEWMRLNVGIKVPWLSGGVFHYHQLSDLSLKVSFCRFCAKH